MASPINAKVYRSLISLAPKMRAFTHLCPVFVTLLVLLSIQQTLGSDQTFDLAKIIAEAEAKADLYREARKFNGARRRKATAE